MNEMAARDLRALAQMVDDRRVVVVRHDNLLAVLRPADECRPAKPRSGR